MRLSSENAELSEAPLLYYTDAVYIVKDFSGELESDSESDRLSWIDIDNLPDIMPTQADYVQGFVKKIKAEENGANNHIQRIRS